MVGRKPNKVWILYRNGEWKMIFVKKETMYTYQMTLTDKLVLTGILVTFHEKGELKVNDKQSEEYIKN
ncbi:hypothetical protein CN931_27625 [Bacillus sp. AFS054943]|uniref:Uncharacterized protein n=1 Tax=Bacillus cereus TaxID=1396 RepID=A0A2A8IR02_BACCE|nr:MULTISPECIES: hypothetical protein [Bacillus]PGL75521.1 hypothetical protein CN931_27625 [Bacillus sp. AFS054943]MDH4424159.1 hypothetical protein [Bacillus cereus]PER21554.1 hypothetical protein CN476_23010 [Bacillus cereus]PFA56845.1 hypothetical protein CN402_23690 [Bacillus sp. AFS015896]PGT97885.1 hypothetical protein COD19_23730 [Bacillus cereus]